MRLTVERKLARAHEEWAVRGARPGTRPKLYMVTLTLPHEDEPGRVERLLDEAWRRMRRHASKTHWSRDTLAVLEWTPGADGRGHPHLHVLVVSGWLDYTEVRGSWKRAAARVGAREPYGRGIQCEPSKRGRKNAARDAAKYVAKYLTSSDKVGLYSVDDWIRLCAWQLGRRTLRATVGWWDYLPAPGCPCCEQRPMFRGVAGSAWTGSDAAGRPMGGVERRRWAVRLYYDPLTGWCRTWVSDDLSSMDASYGTMSMAESTFPMGEMSMAVDENRQKDIDMQKYREDAYMARVKWIDKQK